MLYVVASALVILPLIVASVYRLRKKQGDPYQGKKPDAGGFLFKTEVKLSANPVAGRARYLLEDVKKGEPLRIQPIGSSLLVACSSAAETEEHLAQGTIDLDELSNFGHTTPPEDNIFEDVVFVNKPHLFCNHWPESETNMVTEWTPKYKIIRALRDIPAGVEIKHNYSSGYRHIEWFDDFMAKRRTNNVMQWVRTLSPKSTQVHLDKLDKPVKN